MSVTGATSDAFVCRRVAARSESVEGYYGAGETWKDTGSLRVFLSNDSEDSRSTVSCGRVIALEEEFAGADAAKGL